MNILVLKKNNEFSKHDNSLIYKKSYDLSTNTTTINIIIHTNNRDFLTLQSKMQKIAFYENKNYDTSLSEENKDIIYFNNEEEQNDNNILLSDDEMK